MLQEFARPLRLQGTRLAASRRTAVASSRFASTAANETPETLSWPDYLTIRKKKRKWEMAMTVPCVLAGLVGGASYFGSLEMDPTKPILGVDPMIFFGGATFASMGLGYLVGPIAGSQLWRTTHRRAMSLIEARDREFHAHIVKNRVDPTSQSATNPVPDFYGEKIGSLKDYRQWLRDQARYKRKSRWTEDE
ncbi:mitochondrial import protein Pam17 [Peniophora sp. CONT]|nr:mitochondrial import protein Pam17 [Peniophora sp. CONT]